MEMRIVGITDNRVWVQGKKDGKWHQTIVDKTAFEVMMRMSFPRYVEEYAMSNTDKDMADFFYHYGETESMKRKGEAYIFTA